MTRLFPLLCLGAFAVEAGLQAGWLDDSGYSQLAAELGSAMPQGVGIALMQTEAGEEDTTTFPGETVIRYLPQEGGPDDFAGSGVYAGRTFHPESGKGSALGHAQVVAGDFYADGTGAARGATQVHLYDANDFIARLGSGSGFFNPPESFPGRVQNHSWVGTTGSASGDTQFLRRFDLMLDRDSRVAAVGLFNNPTIMRSLMGDCYHALSVGVRSGNHSQTGTLNDGSGRMKPDLVVNETLTSWATAAVSGVAACLMEAAVDSGNAHAERPEVIKALLLAGASKAFLPTWRRAGTGKPYDAVHGAGELNIRHSWQLLQGGEQAPSTVSERPSTAWDLGSTTTAATGRRYFFRIPEGRYGNAVSVALHWHRSITPAAFGYNAAMSNLSLRLYRSDAFVPEPTPLSESLSTVDNTEHLYHRNLPAGQYMIEVTAGTGNRDYGLAWRVDLGGGPALAVRRLPSGEVFLDASQLDPEVTYFLKRSPDLEAAFATIHSFRTADSTASYTYSWEDPSAPADRGFYLLSWME